MLDERLRDPEQQERARAWLYSTYARVARAHFANVTPSRPFALPLLPPFLTGGDGDVLALGQRLLLRLPRAQREVFWLYEVAQLPMSDVASTLGCTRQAAYSRLFRARARLMELLPLAVAGNTSHG